jgi:hypothetical protein
LPAWHSILPINSRQISIHAFTLNDLISSMVRLNDPSKGTLHIIRGLGATVLMFRSGTGFKTQPANQNLESSLLAGAGSAHFRYSIFPDRPQELG